MWSVALYIPKFGVWKILWLSMACVVRYVMCIIVLILSMCACRQCEDVWTRPQEGGLPLRVYGHWDASLWCQGSNKEALTGYIAIFQHSTGQEVRRIPLDITIEPAEGEGVTLLLAELADLPEGRYLFRAWLDDTPTSTPGFDRSKPAHVEQLPSYRHHPQRVYSAQGELTYQQEQWELTLRFDKPMAYYRLLIDALPEEVTQVLVSPQGYYPTSYDIGAERSVSAELGLSFTFTPYRMTSGGITLFESYMFVAPHQAEQLRLDILLVHRSGSITHSLRSVTLEVGRGCGTDQYVRLGDFGGVERMIRIDTRFAGEYNLTIP